MRILFAHRLRAVAVSGALIALLAPLAGAQPSAAVLGSASMDAEGDAVRITHTADGQLFLRIQGSRAAMLLLDEAAGRQFASSLRAYLERSTSGCSADQPGDAIPRLTAPRAHRSGINGIAVRCGAAGGPGSYGVLVTRPSGEDGPAVEPLALEVDRKAIEAFVATLERLSGKP